MRPPEPAVALRPVLAEMVGCPRGTRPASARLLDERQTDLIVRNPDDLRVSGMPAFNANLDAHVRRHTAPAAFDTETALRRVDDDGGISFATYHQGDFFADGQASPPATIEDLEHVSFIARPALTNRQRADILRSVGTRPASCQAQAEYRSALLPACC